MNSIERSVIVAVPIGEADQEWTRFLLRTAIADHKVTSPELEWSFCEELQHEARVKFSGLEGQRTRVSVAVEYEGSEAAGVAIGQHLSRDLAAFKRLAEARS